jgi:hypothetical protein
VREHRHPFDDLRLHYDKHTVDPLSRLHALTLVAAEQQTMNFYMTIGNRYMEPIARQLYQEIGMIEEQHVTQYESLLDPGETWFEQLVHHEYNEVYLYHSFAAQETDPKVRALWELHLGMEIEQLKVACDLMRRYDGRDPEEVLPAALPDNPVRFEPNKEYVRTVLAEQEDLNALGQGYVRDAHKRYQGYQDAIHGEGPVASEQVIVDHVEKFGEDHRIETEGPHPIERSRDRSPKAER